MNTPNVPPVFQSLDMPSALQQAMATPPKGVPSYQQGGLVTPAGPTGPQGVGVQQGPMDPKMLEMQINQFAQQHPQELAKIRQVIMGELQSGNLTPQELNQIVQLATVAAQNPSMYPQIRQFVIQQGLATEQDLPQQYDQGLVVVLLIAAKAVQQDLGGSPAGAGAPAEAGPIPSMAKGGKVPGKGAMVIEAHEGEFVVPKVAMDWYGRKHFEGLIQKAKEESAMGTGLQRMDKKNA
jgi:hypothetical protein